MKFERAARVFRWGCLLFLAAMAISVVVARGIHRQDTSDRDIPFVMGTDAVTITETTFLVIPLDTPTPVPPDPSPAYGFLPGVSFSGRGGTTNLVCFTRSSGPKDCFSPTEVYGALAAARERGKATP